MGGWRPTKHNYRYRTYINAFFHQRKLRMWVDGVLLNTNANINVFFHQRKLKMWGGDGVLLNTNANIGRI
jgi:hypothetical protein